MLPPGFFAEVTPLLLERYQLKSGEERNSHDGKLRRTVWRLKCFWEEMSAAKYE